MSEYLSAEVLAAHVRVLAEGIGPRAAGSLDEAAARHYIRANLSAAGVPDPEEQRFLTPDTWGYGLIIPTLLALTGNMLSPFGRLGKLLGGSASITGAGALFCLTGGYRPMFLSLAPRRDSANLIVRMTPTGPVHRRVVLLGHTDTNKHRRSFAPVDKHLLRASTTAGIAAAVVNGIAQLAQFVGIKRGMGTVQRLSLLGILAGLIVELADEREGYVDGANDNATAVACLLGLGAHLAAHPLKQTEVWLAFTGAEEVGCLGAHALLDAYGDTLADAWFIDFEMVGVKRIAYVTYHSSFAYVNGYTPDADSLVLAERVARLHPELEVHGSPLVIQEEVGTLIRRGYRGICLAGVGEDGWLVNWHQCSDTFSNIDPAGLERAARFALAMIETLDSEKL